MVICLLKAMVLFALLIIVIPFPKKSPNIVDIFKSANWINMRPMYKKISSEGVKFNHHLYLLEETRAKYF